ncbi:MULTISPECIES: aldehyde dehydrogenase [unclassified Novosphingobium]|uniref:aldehyde dehydrogenase n=1 Tax=unclassified Novosphingobium TaxID=2644732 RepID=UPI000D3F8D7C|nr:acyl-CoA reductase-like NAD-dependent aldehyde dehydrogenase [Novosphingobium sp. GV055]PUB02144.1 acyl-CoA reductase-like NAD-dependent aldehyde dehydrogenase [Novosphingobium sp. GV061]PUB18325.1 acyl-CoA reductase-like NAD-dependent aldehyde dehydrogenase [Novosphingobium sp. GV079]PUB40577.1 acyl-CoA reductase-like NAD-dependent aldehyde dehydrogenase [Novosphingobium sp. GV027]
MLLPHGVHIAHPERLYIGGQWVPAHSGRLIEIISPDSEQVVARVAEADAADMDAAVAAARAAFDHGPWPDTPPAQRIAAFRAMIDHLRPRADELARAWTAQIGGLASFAGPMHQGALFALDGIAGFAQDFRFIEQRPSHAAAAALIVQEPVGVVAAIAPWNGPFGIMANKVAYALLTGCCVVMKPSPETPLEAYLIAEAAEATGLPPGVVNLVPSHREAADHLVNNPGVDKVSFTGSTVAGKRIGQVCAGRVARCTLELGGKSAAIVRDDFAIDHAAKLLTGTITMMSGQVCAMLSRVIVPRARHDELADAIAREMRGVVIGHSDDPAAQLGPVAMQRQLERIEGYIAQGKASADLVTGGSRPSHLNRGYFIEPTLFANVNNADAIAQEEIFGPVLALIPVEDEEEAVAVANASAYGLNGSVLTHDAQAAWTIGRRIRTGGFGQNGLRMDFGLPFGGFKQSGVGREGGPEGLMPYVETKTMLLDALPEGL